MAAGEWEARQAVVKPGVFPDFVVVADVALGTQLAFVLVVFFVAIQAIQRGVPEAGQVFVAAYALHLWLGMGVFQREFGAVVVEKTFGCFPVTLVVAITTLSSQVLLVLVVLHVESS